MNRRKGGRRKGRAVKYSRDEDLRNQFKMAHFGAYHDEPAYYVIPFILNPRLKDKGWEEAKKITEKKYPGEKISDDFTELLFDEIKRAIKKRNWSYFAKLQKMFELAEKTDGKAVDDIRAMCISVNTYLYAKSYVLKTPTPKPRDILKVWRLSCPELIEIEDADCYKIMRELGIPRMPSKKQKEHVWDYFVQAICDQRKNWKIKN